MSRVNKEKTKIGLLSFFSGSGFLDLGFENTDGYEVLFVNENHEPFLEMYEGSRNLLGISEPGFGCHLDDIQTFLKDPKKDLIENVITEARRKSELVGFIGGPPCPDFSIGGKNRGRKGDNGKLTETYIDLINKNNPEFFLFENVKGLYRTKKHRRFFNEMKTKLVSNGYLLTEKLINSLEYGVPQDRERIILIGFKRDFIANYDHHLNGSSKLNSFEWDSHIVYDVNKVMSLDWPTQEEFVEESEKEFPKKLIKELTVQYWFEKNDVNNHPNSEHHFQPRAGLPKFKSIQEGDDLKKSYKRLHRWRYSPTAAYGNNEVHLHPYKARRLSVAESLAIQSLPKEFILPADQSLTNMFKTIGNGVPYLAAKGLAETIMSYVNKLKQHENEKVNSK